MWSTRAALKTRALGLHLPSSPIIYSSRFPVFLYISRGSFIYSPMYFLLVSYPYSFYCYSLIHILFTVTHLSIFFLLLLSFPYSFSFVFSPCSLSSRVTACFIYTIPSLSLLHILFHPVSLLASYILSLLHIFFHPLVTACFIYTIPSPYSLKVIHHLQVDYAL